MVLIEAAGLVVDRVDEHCPPSGTSCGGDDDVEDEDEEVST